MPTAYSPACVRRHWPEDLLSASRGRALTVRLLPCSVFMRWCCVCVHAFSAASWSQLLLLLNSARLCRGNVLAGGLNCAALSLGRSVRHLCCRQPSWAFIPRLVFRVAWTPCFVSLPHLLFSWALFSRCAPPILWSGVLSSCSPSLVVARLRGTHVYRGSSGIPKFWSHLLRQELSHC